MVRTHWISRRGLSLGRRFAVHTWNPAAAARFLDQREGWWAAWPQAARDQRTFCVSCHITIPYALARPTLRAVLREQSPSKEERELCENVAKRVRLWNNAGPYYAGPGS